MAGRAAVNMRSGPKPIKSEDSIPLENLFDDLQDDAGSEIHEDVKKKLPQLKTPGNWNSEIIGGRPKPITCTPRRMRHN